MINKLDYSEKYRRLFNMAFKDLKEENLLSDAELAKGLFTTMSEYLSHAQDYIDISKAKYLLVPLDEGVFSIDANTRLITVPPSFKTCTGIVSDNMAETVVFTIDRYFDYTDLSSLSIEVQWISPDTNAEKRYYVDEIPQDLIDTDLYAPEGLLRFGWPIHNVLTKAAGNVEFSVRFYKEGEDGENVYVLNTLPQIIPIKNSLNLNKNDIQNVETKNDQLNLFRRFVTNYNGPAIGAPTPVSFTIKDLPDSVKINTETDTCEDLMVCAHTGDFNPLNYYWYKQLDTINGEGVVVVDTKPVEVDLPTEPPTVLCSSLAKAKWEEVILIDPQEIVFDLSNEECKNFDDQYISYNNNIYKCNIVEPAGINDNFEAEFFAVSAQLKTKESIDLSENSPYTETTTYQKVDIAEGDKQKRPHIQYWYESQPNVYEPYQGLWFNEGADVPTLYYACPTLILKSREGVDSKYLPLYNNITGTYFAEAVNDRGDLGVTSAQSHKATIHKPSQINFLEGKAPVETSFLVEKGIAKEYVSLTAEINKDDKNPQVIHTWMKEVSEGEYEPITTGVQRKDNACVTELQVETAGNYKLISKSILNRYEETCESNVCTVYKKTAVPKIKACQYGIINSSDIIGKNTIDQSIELTPWFSSEEGDEELSYLAPVDVTEYQIVYINVDCEEFEPFTSGEITYHWFFGLPDEELRELSAADVGGAGCLVPAEWDVNASNIAIKWSWQSSAGEVEGLIKCIVRNKIDNEVQEVTTKTLVIQT